jgi:hypothetical protein
MPLVATIILASVGVTFLWVLFKLGQWSAPLSGSAGVVVFFMAYFYGAYTVSAFGLFVFVMSALLFWASGGMAGR